MAFEIGGGSPVLGGSLSTFRFQVSAAACAPFGVDGIKHALAGIENPTACSTAMAVLQGVTDCWCEPLEDDGTVAVLAIN
jgi:hypothetical protein